FTDVGARGSGWRWGPLPTTYRDEQPVVSSVWLVTANGYAMTVALVGVVVPNRTVLHAAVIPKCDRVRPPLEAYAEFRRFDVPIEHLEQGGALVRSETDNPRREETVDEQALLAGDRVRAKNRMFGARIGLAAIIGPVASTINMLAIVDGRHAIEHLPDRRRQGLVGQIHVREHRVAATVRGHRGQIED